MILYIVFLVSIIIAALAEKTQKKFFLISLILLLGLFVGFRDINTGIDTESYTNIFINLQRGIFSKNIEIGFLLFAKAILIIFHDIQYIFICIGVITNALIIWRLWTMKNICSFSAMVVLYLVLYYSQSFNIMRQFLAISIIFAASYFIQKLQYWKYALCLLIAVLIHYSSILGIILIPVYILFNRNIKKQKKQILIFLGLIIGLISVYFIGTYSLNRYSEYILRFGSAEWGLMNIAKILVVILFILTSVRKYKKKIFSYDKEDELVFGAVIVFYLLSCILACLGYYVSTLTRISYIFAFFEMPFITYVSSYGINKRFFKIIYFIYLVTNILINISNGWGGVIYYSPYFI